jgi:hypothetical protein
MMVGLRRHNDDEETKDLPLLEPHLGADGSKSAAMQFSRTKHFAPTRWVFFLMVLYPPGERLCSAHPSAPNKPPFETLIGFLVAPIDKLKDAFAKFPTEEMKEAVKD